MYPLLFLPLCIFLYAGCHFLLDGGDLLFECLDGLFQLDLDVTLQLVIHELYELRLLVQGYVFVLTGYLLQWL